MRQSRLLPAIVGVYVAVGVVGCGGDGDGDDAPTTLLEDRQIEPEAQARAESIVLQLSDFPEGWRASAPDPADKGEEEEEELVNCMGLDYSGITITGEEDSQEFAMGDSAEVESDATVYPSTQEAETASQKDVAALGDDATFEGCFRDGVEQAIEEQGEGEVGLELGEVDLGELSFTPPPGIEEAKAWQIEVPFEITSGEFKGASESLYFELVGLRRGDVRATVQSQDEGSPFDAGLRDQLVQAVARRMQEAPN